VYHAVERNFPKRIIAQRKH